MTGDLEGCQEGVEGNQVGLFGIVKRQVWDASDGDEKLVGDEVIGW